MLSSNAGDECKGGTRLLAMLMRFACQTCVSRRRSLLPAATPALQLACTLRCSRPLCRRIALLSGAEGAACMHWTGEFSSMVGNIDCQGKRASTAAEDMHAPARLTLHHPAAAAAA